jgi:hypothetical protein
MRQALDANHTGRNIIASMWAGLLGFMALMAILLPAGL